MAQEVPADLAEKAAIMREFGRRRAAGEPVSAELYAQHVNATNDRYTTGPEPAAETVGRGGHRFARGRLQTAHDLPDVGARDRAK